MSGTRTTGRTEAQLARTLGQRFVDWMATFFGSVVFGLLFTAITLVWLHWLEPPPYGNFTMVLSLLAIYMAWILLMNQNRQAKKDREMAARDDEEIGLLVALQQEQMLSHRFEKKALSALLNRTPIALAELDLEALRSVMEKEKRRLTLARDLAGSYADGGSGEVAGDAVSRRVPAHVPNEHYDHVPPTAGA